MTDTAPIPAWLALNVMTDAVINTRWGEYDLNTDGCTPEDWVVAKEGDFLGTRDEMVDALTALATLVGFEVDWDAEPPEPTLINAAEVLRAGEG